MGNTLKLPKDYQVGKKSDWGEGYIKHKQDELYRVPTNLICDILVKTLLPDLPDPPESL